MSAWVLSFGPLVLQLAAAELMAPDSQVNQIILGIQNNTPNRFNVRSFQRVEAGIKQGKWTCVGVSQTGPDKTTGLNATETLTIAPNGNWVMCGQRNHLNSTNSKAYINLAPDWGSEPVTLYIGSNNGGSVWFDYLVSTQYQMGSNPQDTQTGGNLAHFTKQAAGNGAFRAPAGQWGTGKNVFQFAFNVTDGTSTKPAEIYVTITLEPA